MIKLLITCCGIRPHRINLFGFLLCRMATASAELKFLLTKEKVDEKIQTIMFQAGVVSVKQLASLVKDAAEMRELAKTDFELGECKTLADKVKLSNLLCAYNAAKARAMETDRMDAENEVRSQPKVVASTDYVAMREAFKLKYWALDDVKAPAKTYVEKKLEGLEKADFRAEKLTEVVAYREDDRDTLHPIWDLAGTLKTVKAQSTVPLPTTTEELRLRISILGAAWVFTSFHQTANRIVKDLDPFLFTAYTEHLLGEHVWGLTAKRADGAQVAGPTWTLLLSYEHELRSHAYSLVCNEGRSLKEALNLAMRDSVIKDRFFVTPLALESMKRTATHSGLSAEPQQTKWPNNPQNGGGKGKGDKSKKGKDKGKGKAQPPANCSAKTPGGKNVCFRFNTREGCRARVCRFEHVCGVCFKENTPMHNCNHA